MGYKVILTPQAIQDLREIVAFIARDNPVRAEEFGVELCGKTKFLVQQPYMGRVVPEFRQNDIRELIHKSYRIVYGIHEETKAIYVYQFWHGALGAPPPPPAEPFL